MYCEVALEILQYLEINNGTETQHILRYFKRFMIVKLKVNGLRVFNLFICVAGILEKISSIVKLYLC